MTTTTNRPRRSRQVRSSRRRSVDRAIRRGRPRTEALSEYHRAGGRLDKHERIIAGLERKAELEAERKLTAMLPKMTMAQEELAAAIRQTGAAFFALGTEKVSL